MFRLNAVFSSLFFIQKFGHICVILISELFMHASHDSDVVIVQQVNFLHVQVLWHLTTFISKKELSDVIWFKVPLAILIRILFIRDLSHEDILVIFGLLHFACHVLLLLPILILNQNASFLKRGYVTLNSLKLPNSESEV